MAKIVLKKRKNIKIKKKIKKAMNDSLVELLGRLEELMTMKGEPFRARAYHKAAETIMLFEGNITNIDQLKGRARNRCDNPKKIQGIRRNGNP